MRGIIPGIGFTATPSTFTVTASNYAPNGGGSGSGPFTTGSCIITSTGQSDFTYAWSRKSGDSSISISSATAQSVTWSATGTSQTKSAVWACTVTDSTGRVATSPDITVSLSFNSTVAHLSSTTATATMQGNGTLTTSAVSVIVDSGTAPYTYLWEKVGGDSISITSSTASSSTFSGTGVAGQTLTAQFRCKVTSTGGEFSYTDTLTVTLTYTKVTLSAGVDNTYILGETYGESGPTFTNAVTCTASGGTAPYTYQWSRLTGDSGSFAVTPNLASTYICRYGSYVAYYKSTWKCTVTDATGATATTPEVTADIYFNSSY